MRTIIAAFCGVALITATTLEAETQAELNSLLQAEILFEAQRGHAFDALLKLNRNLSHGASSHNNNINKDELLLALGLSLQVEKNIKAGLYNNPQQRNHNLYLLAKFYYEKQQPVKTLQVLKMIQGDIKQQDKRPLQQLTALASIRVGKHSTAANILEKLAKNNNTDNSTDIYVQYNLALAQLQSNNEKKGLSTLLALGQINSSDEEQLALKDLANLKLGNHYLEQAQPAQAKVYFNRVRMDSPFIEQTLLGSGWANFSLAKPERAIVSWTLLYNSKLLSDSVIEAKMALPYAYAKLGAHGKAANLYGQTIQTLEAELSQLDSAIKLAQNGELQQYLISVLETQQKNTYTQLLADKQKQPFYLHTLLTDVQFRLLVDSLRELVLSQQRLHQQQNKIDTLNKLATSKLKQIAASQSKTTKPVKHLKNQSKTYQQFGKQKKQLIKLSAQLKQIKNKLTPVLIEAGKQLSLLAENKLQQQHEKLESYRINALFALAESYDLATRQQ
jgi:hypothetical protein